MTKAFNKASEKIKRRTLRKNMPLAEVILWTKLKEKSFCGYKFRRQYSVGKFVIDFYCPMLKLAVEVDGESHFTEEAKTRDKERQVIIEDFGIIFLRFTNKDIYENIDGVLSKIAAHLKDIPPQPLLVKEGIKNPSVTLPLPPADSYRTGRFPC